MNFQILRDFISASGGRRFLLTLGCGIVNSLLVMHGHIPADVYRDLILGTVAVYIAGSTYQKVKGNDPGADS